MTMVFDPARPNSETASAGVPADPVDAAQLVGDPLVRAVWRTRVLSALVMAPIALALAWIGGWAFALLLMAAAIVMAHELGRLLLEGGGPFDVPILAGCGVVAVAITAAGYPFPAVLVVAGVALTLMALRTVQNRPLLPALLAISAPRGPKSTTPAETGS